MRTKTKKKKKKKYNLALVLSGGAASGMAHIGVIRVLESKGIFPDIVIGTSTGALIGGMYCAGVLDKFENVISNKTKHQIRKILHFWPSREGLIKTDRLERQLRTFINNKKIEGLDRKFMAISVDILTGKKVLHNKGDLCKAILASISIPFLFPPVHKKGMLLVDGGLEDPLPIDEGFNFARKVIAVNIVHSLQKIPKKMKYNFIDIFKQIKQILEIELINFTIKKETPNLVLLNPKLNIGTFEFDKSEKAILIGKKETIRNIYKIKKLIKK